MESLLGAGLAVAGVARATTQVRTPTLIADFGQVYLSLQGGTTGTRVLDASNNEMLKIEADETQCLTRVLSVTNSASASTTGLVIKNTATTGTARLQLDANTATGFAQLGCWHRQLHPERARARDLAAESTHRPGASHSGDERHRHHRLWPERPLGREGQAEHQGRRFGRAADHLRPGHAEALRSGRRRPEGPAGFPGPGLAERRA